MDGLSRGAIVRYTLRSWKAFWHSSVHLNAFLRTLKKGKHLSVAFETNLFKAATHLVRDWTSLTFFGGSMFIIAWILSGFTSIPLYETMNLRNFPDETSKVHLLGFSYILYRLSVSKVSCRSSRCFFSSKLFTNISST